MITTGSFTFDIILLEEANIVLDNGSFAKSRWVGLDNQL
jgi:hypothetical protein